MYFNVYAVELFQCWTRQLGRRAAGRRGCRVGRRMGRDAVAQLCHGGVGAEVQKLLY